MQQTPVGKREWLPLPERKAWRAEVINSYLASCAGLYAGVVCFTCGNAGKALADMLDTRSFRVVTVGPGQQLQPSAWWSAEQIHRTWPHHFDATSGHLAPPLMAALAEHLKIRLGYVPADRVYEIPTGSGETFVALCMAFPAVTFAARHNVHDNPGTEWHPEAPLNGLVDALSRRLRITGVVGGHIYEP